MINHEGLYTSLTWPQLLIGLIIGLIAAFVMNATEQMPRRRRAGRGGTQIYTGHWEPKSLAKAADERVDLPQLVVSIIRAAYYTLGVLATARKPVFLGSIVRRVHAAQKANKDRELLTPVAIRASLDRLVSHGNVRLGRHGISITESGVELFTRLARINERPAQKGGQRKSLKSPAVQAGESEKADSAALTAVNG